MKAKTKTDLPPADHPSETGYTIRGVARFLDLSRSTVVRYGKAGHLEIEPARPGFFPARITEQSLRRFMAVNR